MIYFMNKTHLFYLAVMLSFIFTGCKDFVANVDPPINAIEDQALNNQSQMPFLIKGVEIQFTDAFSKTEVGAAELSDAFFFTYNGRRVSNGDYEFIDEGNISLYNSVIDEDYTSVGQLRYYADDLIRRINSISISDTSKKEGALFTGYFYGGFARYLYAAYYGLTTTQGGSPINKGPFINSNDMYDLAIDRFKQSLKYTSDVLLKRSVNSVIARAFLYKGVYDSAAIFAARGLIYGDTPFLAVSARNTWWSRAGNLLLNLYADSRFKKYIDTDVNEANRIKLDSVIGTDGKMYYYQAAYPEGSSRLKIISWQENNLMKAELILRGASNGDALGLVNEVRSYYGIDSLNSVSLNVIYAERDKELFPSGNRLVDERRFPDKWPSGIKWKYLPIPQSERNGNPNIN